VQQQKRTCLSQCMAKNWCIGSVGWSGNGKPGVAALAHQCAIGAGYGFHQRRLTEVRQNDNRIGRPVRRTHGKYNHVECKQKG
jgi:hypothetical protein